MQQICSDTGISQMNIPVVNLERGEDDDTISVQCDNYQGGKLAAEHLIECGCKIFYISAASPVRICPRTGVRMDLLMSVKGEFHIGYW